MKPRILILNPGKPFYEEVVKACGAEAVCKMYPEVSTDYDGLLLCGGADIDPVHFGQENNGSVNINSQRDENEIAISKAFIRAGKPIFGICRGLQMINTVLGGTLHQNIPTADSHRAPGDAVHAVTAVEESYLYQLYGKHFSVNSAHHQAIDKLGEDLRITLTCDFDGAIEAVEHTSLPIYGVQWHPERMCLSKKREDTVDGIGAFQHFIDLCKQ